MGARILGALLGGALVLAVGSALLISARGPRPPVASRSLLESQAQTGQKFLAENAKKQGVVVLPSGLQYHVVHAGTGPRPTASDAVRCHYRGTLIDGTEFDSSYRHGRPATFGVAAVVAGWREALQLMPVGSRWQLIVPPELAYGERGIPGPNGDGYRVPPNSVLVFEVDLLGLSAPAVEQSAATGRKQLR